MGRPRKHNVDIPGLSHYFDPRTNKIYWRYRNPVTGKTFPMGTDRDRAAWLATEANRRFTEQRIQNMIIAAEEHHDIIVGLTVMEWVNRYIEMQELRQERGELKKTTVDSRRSNLALFTEVCGNKMLTSVTVKDIAATLKGKLSEGKNRMAQVIRATISDLFKEAQHTGEVQPGFNPAEATRNPKVKISRERITLDEWRQVFAAAEKMAPWAQNCMLLAVVTGQRRGDIAEMKFTDIWDDMLHVEQGKTGAKVAIPLSLRCEALDISLREVIARCRDNTLSPNLIHSIYARRIAKQKLTDAFTTARKKTGLTWKRNPPSFHEQRSLSERLYAAQGIDTQILLGHRSRTMTEIYHDDRGREWKVVGG